MKTDLTEFEKAVGVAIGSWNPDEEGKKGVRAVANKLLSIARKQFVKELPKWEKCTLPNYNSGWGINSDYLINPKGDYIKLSEIENVFENNYE